jgi:purine-nucleoside/S-methyl-5'-thioadenosine phosphorylase / adenosine deaminase
MELPRPPTETFPALEKIRLVEHAFVTRVPGIDVTTDRAEALKQLAPWHALAREAFGRRLFRSVNQVHGKNVVVVDARSVPQSEGADGLVTNDPDVLLGIYVADCCAVFLVDPTNRSIGLVHSGRKGSEMEIVVEAVRTMERELGINPSNIVAQLSPCIRPPYYEVDFASTIIHQLRKAGVLQIHDSGANTGGNLKRYYSYRMERGRTGRMLALLALARIDHKS